MASCSMVLITVINIVTLISSIAVVVSYANYEEEGFPCVVGAANPMLQIGIIGTVVGVIGLLGISFGSRELQYTYLWLLLVATISGVVIFSCLWGMLPVLNAYHTFDKYGINGFWLQEGYTNPLLKTALVNQKAWYQVSRCLQANSVCDLYKTYVKAQNYIQNGCCTPPRRCGMVLGNQTTPWVEAPTGLVSGDEGCRTWARYGGNSCFECDECRAGYIGTFHDEWILRFNLNVGILISAVILSGISYYAIKVEKGTEAKEDDDERGLISSSHHRL